MELRVLGPVELRIADRSVNLGRGRKLALIVALLGLNEGKPLPRESMLERIFDGGTPNVATLQTYVTRLRNRLQGAGATRSVLAHRSGSYALAIERDKVDWLRFCRLHNEALRIEPSGDDDAALAKLDEARELWRGEPLTGLSGGWVHTRRESMRRTHCSVLAAWGRIALRARPAHELISQLNDDIALYPLSEPLTYNLMRALHTAGRTDEALSVYTDLREQLAETRGTDPDPQLQEAFQAMLGPPTGVRGQRGFHQNTRPETPTARNERDVSPIRPMRDTLQRGVSDFSGRAAELASLLDAVRGTTTVTDVHVISGMPGVGKSTLATRAGHLLRDDFPDARLHLDLHGNRDHPPKDPMEALRELLTMLGVPGSEVQQSLELRAAQWRDTTAGMRALLILDDARDRDQVRWLLPGGRGWTVFVTSRNRLPDLEGARNHRLGTPPPKEAARLFATLADQDLSEGHGQHAELVRRAEHLPLALRLLANRWRRHPAWTITDLTEQLERARDRLAEFHVGSASLHAAFRVSLHALSPRARAAFIRLGLHPVPEFGVHAAAAVTGESLERTREALNELADASLVEEPWPHRYTMHALLAEFARECAEEELSHGDRRGATHRAMEFYLAVSVAADRAYLPHRHRLDNRHNYPVELPEIRSRHDAVTWFEAECPTLLAVLGHAASEGGFEHHESGMAHALAELLDTSTSGGTAVEFHHRAVDIAALAGDHERLGHALLDLGKAQLRGGDSTGALHSAGAALHHWREAGDQVGRARTHDLIGFVRVSNGQPARAQGDLHEALELAREAGHPPTVADALEHLGESASHLGEHQAAIAYLTEARDIHREQGNVRAQAVAISTLSAAHQALGQYPRANALADEAETLLCEVGDKRELAQLIINKAEIKSAEFAYERAIELYLRALDTIRELHDHTRVAQTLYSIGHAYLNLDNPISALRYLNESWERAAETSERVNVSAAEILVAIGNAHRHLNSAQRATEFYDQAIEAARRDGTAVQEAWALAGLAHVASREGTQQHARNLFLEGQSILERNGHPDAVLLGILADVVVDDDMREILCH